MALSAALDRAFAPADLDPGLEADVEGSREEFDRRAQALSPRERQVLSLVVKGRMNKQIADQHGLTGRAAADRRGCRAAR
mgnify:CR=1 FL=1